MLKLRLNINAPVWAKDGPIFIGWIFISIQNNLKTSIWAEQRYLSKAKASTGSKAQADRAPAWNTGENPAFTSLTMTWLMPIRKENVISASAPNASIRSFRTISDLQVVKPAMIIVTGAERWIHSVSYSQYGIDARGEKKICRTFRGRFQDS